MGRTGEEMMAQLAVETILGDPAKYGGTLAMQVNGLTCTLNMPAALRSNLGADGEETAHALPPYAQRAAFSVDEYPECPASWMRGSGTESSYFVPVKPEHGLWFDFNPNVLHAHDVAVLISVQGINPLTGQKTDVFRLEQYKENCPVHGKPFGQERFCEECKFKWPGQNYLATTGTPHGLFWLDGFRAPDGKVRQWVFTEEEMRGVAAQLIGADRVFAIGITFFLSKEPKPAPSPLPVIRRSAYGMLGGLPPAGGSSFPDGLMKSFGASAAGGAPHGTLSMDTLEALEDAGQEVYAGGPPEQRHLLSSRRSSGMDGDFRARSATIRPKRLEVAAGARIQQQVYDDPREIGYWADEPAGVIYVNYCDEATAARIITAGRRDLTAGGEGFMQNLQVGHTPGAPTEQQ
ncbi:MAG: hypothetical protein HY437_02295 [Candidatus Magasanikbacteria bacterium]|nr:hypothetical protein [Candidatus Magasanikbacteria bacterium]